VYDAPTILRDEEETVMAHLERSREDRGRRRAARTAASLAALLAACGAPEEPPVAEVRPVRTVTVEELPGGETVTLTGRIEAQEEVRLAFRVGQRMIERKVNVGDRVLPGQLIARLESTTLQNAVQVARANLASAEASAADARLEFDRQRTLLERGVAPRARFEGAQKMRDSAVAQVDAARAQLSTAREQQG
jgi:multidrug efflux pump subunit AcrA (membrane-fusion protein)